MKELKAGRTIDDSADGVNKEIGGLVTGKPVGKD
jgi:hypothetical protein